MIKTIFIILFALVVFYLLYKNGFLVFQNKRALSFIGKNRAKEASFSRCHGYIQRYISFDNSREVHFDFNLNLNEGEVKLELFDQGKTILTLDSNQSKGSVLVEGKKKYLLKISFNKASGDYHLNYK